MKFTIDKRSFGQAVRTAHTFSKAGRDADPFRFPVTLAASPLGLEISAFDGKAILTQRVPAGVSASGSVSLDAHALRDALAGAKARQIVTFEAQCDPGNAAMAACRLLDGKSETPLGDAWTGNDNHPRLQLGGRLEARLEVPATELAAIVAETAFPASTDLLRPDMNGIFIESHEGRLRAVATDGHRMAIRDTDIPLAETALPEDGCGKCGAILPLKPLRALRGLLKGGGTATLEIWTQGVRFRCRTGEVATAFLDGTFPDYRHATPSGRMKSAPLDLAALVEAMKAAMPGPWSAGRWPKVTLNGSVTLTGYRDCDSDGEETLLPVKCRIKGDPISFDGRSLEHASRAFGQARTRVRYTGPRHPAVFMSPDRPELVVVQMPACV